jgi:hypothetical protein
MLRKSNRDFVALNRNSIAPLNFSNYTMPMGQQHRVQTKRKRRKAYLKRKREMRRSVRPEPPKRSESTKAKPKKRAATSEGETKA